MHIGTKFDYLGMVLDFEGDGGISISMFKHLNGVLKDFSEEVKGKAAMPAASHLFNVRGDGAHPLPPDQSDAFHHSTAQLLFISAHGRRNLQPI